jgi:hypothetical protein
MRWTWREVRIAKVIRQSNPRAYCDACLAFGLDLSLHEARSAAVRLAGRSPAFERAERMCEGCGRAIAVTRLRAPDRTATPRIGGAPRQTA